MFENSYSFPSSKVHPFSQIGIHTILGFHESAFPCLFRLELHNFTPFKPKIFLGRTPKPPPSTVSSLTHYTMLYVRCVSVLGKNQVGHILSKKAVSMAKLDLNHTNAPSHPFCVLFFFFFCFSKFFGCWTPLTKIPGSAPELCMGTNNFD